jgi:hypothetical protein
MTNIPHRSSVIPIYLVIKAKLTDTERSVSEVRSPFSRYEFEKIRASSNKEIKRGSVHAITETSNKGNETKTAAATKSAKARDEVKYLKASRPDK